MAMSSFPEILLSILVICFLSIWCMKKWHSNCPILFKYWPVIRMLPGLLKNSHRVHDFVTEILKEHGGTFTFVGPWFTNMDMLVTGDPANVHHILSKNFSNYPKGPKFRTMFDILGDGILSADSNSWENHRKIAMSLVNKKGFQKYVTKTIREKVENSLVQVLETFADRNKEVDLQDLFQRLTFDCNCILVSGYDPGSLSVDLPYSAVERAINDAEDAVLYRHILPEFFWKLLKWFNLGKEKKYGKAQMILNQFVARCISWKREALKANKAQIGQNKDDDSNYDLLTGYLESFDDEKFLHDSTMNWILAGTHTVSALLSWFFWILAKNPSTEKKILEEIVKKLDPENGDKKIVLDFSNTEEVFKKMVYLHGALCEALRLFPTIPINHKFSLEQDILPNGVVVKKNTRVLLSFYTMGRMETIWGDDCLEFKPERWITEQGGIKHEPSSKFTAFNAGPRACLGKNMSFIQIKIAVISIICNFKVEVVEGHHVSPSNTVVLQMKDGLKVRVSKRNM